MKQFSSTVAKIKNSNGMYESIPALRGMSSYEVAREAGFTGTEEEWLEFMFDDGWVSKFQELANNKANKTDVHTKAETLSDQTKELFMLSPVATPDDVFTEVHKLIYTYQKPWNVDENVGLINSVLGSFSYSAPSQVEATTFSGSTSIHMINSGEIYFQFDITSNDSTYGYLSNISIKLNENSIISFDGGKGGDRLTGKKVIGPIAVSKDDILTLELSVYQDSLYGNVWVKLEAIGILANIETPYKYYKLFPSNDVPTDEIINTLLGV